MGDRWFYGRLKGYEGPLKLYEVLGISLKTPNFPGANWGVWGCIRGEFKVSGGFQSCYRDFRGIPEAWHNVLRGFQGLPVTPLKPCMIVRRGGYKFKYILVAMRMGVRHYLPLTDHANEICWRSFRALECRLCSLSRYTFQRRLVSRRSFN